MITGGNGRRKQIRRSIRKKKENETLAVMYSNIQGITKKKESLINIMEELDIDICLLAETLTRNVKIDGCRCFTPNKSVGQNVCIIIRKKVVDNDIIKLYEPNETINMIGIRIEMLNSCIRIYTAHLKQQSVSSRDETAAQFEELRKQFQDATKCNEGMLIVFDANVHLGREVLKNVAEKQDWGGKELMKLVGEENLIVLNALDICSGNITRIDPRNGNGTTIDLAICNQFLVDKVPEMKIDEEEIYKPMNYAPVIKKTDHNTITLKVKVDRRPKRKPEAYINLKDNDGKVAFKEYMEKTDIDSYLKHTSKNDLQMELDVINELWSDAINHSFKKITPKRKCKSGISLEVRELMREERWVRVNVLENPDRGRRIADIRKRITQETEKQRNLDVVEKMKAIQEAKSPQAEIYKIRRERNQVQKIGFPLKIRMEKFMSPKVALIR